MDYEKMTVEELAKRRAYETEIVETGGRIIAAIDAAIAKRAEKSPLPDMPPEKPCIFCGLEREKGNAWACDACWQPIWDNWPSNKGAPQLAHIAAIVDRLAATARAALMHVKELEAQVAEGSKGYSREEMLEYAGHRLAVERLDVAMNHIPTAHLLQEFEKERAAEAAAAQAILDRGKKEAQDERTE